METLEQRCEKVRERLSRSMGSVPLERDMMAMIDHLLAEREQRKAEPTVAGYSGPLFVIFDGPPSHESGRFVEVETADGRGVGMSTREWRERPDGLWSLGPFYEAAPPATESNGNESSKAKVDPPAPSAEPVAELTFNAFRAANKARCLKWHPAGIESWSSSDWLVAVTGELGELASLLKMRNRERDGLPGNKFSPTQKQVADELADVLTYLDLLAEVLGVNLGRAAVEKFNEVSERVGFSDRIVLEKSHG